ncbi:hypothetical protein SS50377_26860 [Spironucleus salmonicida]|uniref:Uncharacterized protein n=1 Tax=Spironucleus salmonicida TaxID=348837 RepID=V6LYJ8_9EUKA|nr:hypothetical protein SS50377_26860 [Spironucleus salmonicida]|eukprot:EST49328.1 Hypothetical protein SS50377_10554 [Spironucleus salmonicida]
MELLGCFLDLAREVSQKYNNDEFENLVQLIALGDKLKSQILAQLSENVDIIEIVSNYTELTEKISQNLFIRQDQKNQLLNKKFDLFTENKVQQLYDDTKAQLFSTLKTLINESNAQQLTPETLNNLSDQSDILHSILNDFAEYVIFEQSEFDQIQSLLAHILAMSE